MTKYKRSVISEFHLRNLSLLKVFEFLQGRMAAPSPPSKTRLIRAKNCC
jgi:hypothetical protein